MKKLLLSSFVLVFFIGNSALDAGKDEILARKEIDQEIKRKERAFKEGNQQIKKEQKDERRELTKAEKAEQRQLKKAEDAETKRLKAIENEQRRALKLAENARREAEKEAQKNARREQKNKEYELRKIKEEEELAIKFDQREEKRSLEKSRHSEQRNKKLEELEHNFFRRRQISDEQRMHREGKINLNTELRKCWRDLRSIEVNEEYAAGAYADLYKSPSLATYATFVPLMNYLNVSSWYSHAKEAYLSDGSVDNISKLFLGENAIRVKDILLVSNLAQQGLVTPSEPVLSGVTAPNASSTSQYLKLLADEHICFSGRSEEFGLSFDFARHLWKNHVVIGVQLPVLFKNNSLHMTMARDVVGLADGTLAGGLREVRADNGAAFVQRYGQDAQKFLYDILAAKGIHHLGGKVSGLSDITLFIQAIIDTNCVDCLMTGLRFVVPTAQKESLHKLWAPVLGNGGVVEGAWWGSVVFNKHSYFNPHLFLQVNISSVAEIQRRVPFKTTVTNLDLNPQSLKALGLDVAFGDRVKLAKDKGFSLFDANTLHFGDKVASLKVEKGAEFNFRIGNIFEKIPLRRSFMDLYYDFRVKVRDDVVCLNEEEWAVDLLEKCTTQIAHKVGLEWSYQFDLGSRWRLGTEYTFAGQNVPKAFLLHASMNYCF